jgi:hypothetical protein
LPIAAILAHRTRKRCAKCVLFTKSMQCIVIFEQIYAGIVHG